MSHSNFFTAYLHGRVVYRPDGGSRWTGLMAHEQEHLQTTLSKQRACDRISRNKQGSQVHQLKMTCCQMVTGAIQPTGVQSEET